MSRVILRVVILLVMLFGTERVIVFSSGANGIETAHAQPSADAQVLLAAAKSGDAVRVKGLLARGASPNVIGAKGWTPLMFAAISGRTEIAELLIVAGATIDAMSEDGATPLMVATLKGHTKIVSLLLDHGAQVTLKNKDGVNAFIIAKEKRFTPIIELMSGGPPGWSRDEEGEWIRPVSQGSSKSGRGQLAGSTWTGGDTTRNRMTIVFEPGGKLRLSLQPECQGPCSPQWSEGVWRQEADDVMFEINNGYATYQGTIYGAAMNGSARNKLGVGWRWRVTQE